MKYLTKLGLVLAFVFPAALMSVQAFDRAGSCHRAPHVEISASVFGAFNGGAEGGPAWVGHMLIKFGNQGNKAASFIDRGAGLPTVREDGSIFGTETYTVLFDDGISSFQIECKWEGIPEATPGLYALHEAGRIVNGTGDYDGLSGTVIIKGLFMTPDPTINPTSLNPNSPPLFVGQLRGRISGLK